MVQGCQTKAVDCIYNCLEYCFSLVSSCVDYFNSLFVIQHCLACFVSGASRFSHITPTLLFTGFLLNNESFSKLLYSFISTLPLESQNTLLCICIFIHLLLKQDIVIQKRCFSKFPSTALQFINLKFISTRVSHMMLQNFEMICYWKFKLLLHYQASKGDLKLICFRSLFFPRLSYY